MKFDLQQNFEKRNLNENITSEKWNDLLKVFDYSNQSMTKEEIEKADGIYEYEVAERAISEVIISVVIGTIFIVLTIIFIVPYDESKYTFYKILTVQTLYHGLLKPMLAYYFPYPILHNLQLL